MAGLAVHTGGRDPAPGHGGSAGRVRGQGTGAGFGNGVAFFVVIALSQ